MATTTRHALVRLPTQHDEAIARKVRYDKAVSGAKMRWIHSRDAGRRGAGEAGCDDPGLYGLVEASAIARRAQTDGVLVAEGSEMRVGCST